ncbi:MAG: DNA mismatch repair protein MutS [Clostridia bacterium]|nr:DNA mismatch repair protein MutS [Clostridia bacterium]
MGEQQKKLSLIIDKSKLSPMMQQYVDTKDNYPDCLLFYRLGDFYELFFEDAKIASKTLDIALTGRNCGMEEKAPMCGVPFHAVEGYIAKLIEKGYKVAICDQVTEPIPGKIVERAVTRIITPGTVIETEILDEKTNNFILSICKKGTTIGLAYCDVSTGEFKVSEYKEDSLQKCLDLFSRIRPSEIICNEEMYELSFDKTIKSLDFLPNFSKQPEYSFDEQNALEQIKKQFSIQSIQGHDFAKLDVSIRATGALIIYLLETQKRNLNHINKIITENHSDYMHLDYNACRNLELIENIKDKKKKGSLLGHLNKTKTAMGSRLLEKWILQPLQNSKIINNRLDCLEELFYNPMILNDIQAVLVDINDIARICSKISYGTIMPKECISLKNSLFSVLTLANLVKDLNNQTFRDLFSDTESIKNIAELLDKAFVETSPNILANGGYIKEDFNKELYTLKNISTEAKKWLADLEAKEREETGIKNLKIGYSRVFGYFIEINKSQESQVPYRYVRKQTISNHERFVTDELKQIEEKLLNAQDASIKLEAAIFDKIKEHLKQLIQFIQQTANDVAYLDTICSLAVVSQDNQYTRPVLSERIKHIKIEDGRHPIVETNLKNESFVPNDAYLDEKNDRTLIITGPNMAGKSTYMRQIALIVIMAHIGCFVPAKFAEMSIVDRIFTRIGASDDLNSGQSTFMVEMVEVANILNNATNKSLVLLDEVGRGTATYDGMSIAWAVLEYVSQQIRCKTLFSTHYHEITSLEGKLEGVKNYKIGVKEFNNSIIFLRKIVRGSADKSFGIEVAALSGIYDDIISRAKAILNQLEKNSVKLDLTKVEDKTELTSFDKENIINQLKNLDVNRLSPMEAFEILIDLNKKVKK